MNTGTAPYGEGNNEYIQCRRFFAVNNNVPVDEAGVFCLTIDPPSRQGNNNDGASTSSFMGVSYSTSGNWRIGNTYSWLGTDLADLPVNGDGEPQIDQFDYITDAGLDDNSNNAGNGKNNKNNKSKRNNRGLGEDEDDEEEEEEEDHRPVRALKGQKGITSRQGQQVVAPMLPVQLDTTETFDVDLADLGIASCDTQGANNPTLIYGVGTTDLVDSTNNESATGWVDGLLPADQNIDVWTLFNFTVQCVDPTTLSVPPPGGDMGGDMGGGGGGGGTLPDGSACAMDSECISGGCDVTLGFCKLSQGESCGENEACGSGNCVDFLCGAPIAGDNGNFGGDDGLGDGGDDFVGRGDGSVTGCGGIASANSPLSEEVVLRSTVAADLTQVLQTNGAITADVTDVSFFNGQTTMIGKTGGVCYGIFAPPEPADYTTAGFGVASLSNYEQTCQVHDAAYNAYFTNERQIFELRLAQCASTCMTSDFSNSGITNQILSVALDRDACPIVLAGHGFGGAVAVVASMMMLDLDPSVITMGAPRAVGPGCPLMMDSERHYRYVNLGMIPSMDTYLFDAIPQLGDGGPLVHYGTPVLLDPAMETIVLDLDDDTTRASMYSPVPTNDVMTPSLMSLYATRMSDLAMSSCFPVPATAAWENGHWCDQNDLCVEDRCRTFVTTDSGVSFGVCAQKMQAGEVCDGGADCASGTCTGGVCGAAGGDSSESGGGVVDPGFSNPVDPNANQNNQNVPQDSGNIGGGGSGTKGSCSPCGTGAECVSGVCSSFAGFSGSGGTSVCAETPQGTMSNGCFCDTNDNLQCTSGRCESDSSGVLWLCVAALDACQSCDEPSDCLSGNCEGGVCGLTGGGLPADCSNGGGGGGGNAPGLELASCEACTTSSDCASGFCRTVGTVSCELCRNGE